MPDLTSPTDPWDKWNRRMRDLAIWILGIAAGYNELFNREEVRWPAVAFILFFLGYPVADGLDRFRRKNGNGDGGKTQDNRGSMPWLPL